MITLQKGKNTHMSHHSGSFLRCVIYLKKPAETTRLEVSFFKPLNALISIYNPVKERFYFQELDKSSDSEEVSVTLENPAGGTYYIEVTNGFYHQGKEIRI